jgi:hypothetical protein
VRVKVNLVDHGALLSTLANEVAKVFEGDLALAENLESLFASGTQLLHGTRQANAQVVSREAQHLTHRTGNSGTVRMHVVDGSELRGDLGRESVR